MSVGVLTFGLTGCGETKVGPASVSLDAKSLTVEVGKVSRIKASISKGYSGEVRWFTTNESIVTVHDGYCYGISEGTATITAAFGGGFADCPVTVIPNGGETPTEKLTLSESSKTMKQGETFNLTYSVYPLDTTVTFESNNPSVASVSAITGGAQISGLSEGTAIITATGSNNRTATCSVTVKSSSAPTDYDIAVPDDLKYTGSLIIGSPDIQLGFMQSLLSDFNRLTNSNISFTVVKFEEDNGTSGYASATSMPAVFPYASDQTLTLQQFQALNTVSNSDKQWITTNMGQGAADAATLGRFGMLGYPFAADNGVVMFYNTSIMDQNKAENITVDELFELADDNDLDVNYTIGNGFYASGLLMTYTGGKSLYSLTPTTTSYSSKSSFNSDEGVKGAQLLHRIANKGTIRNATDAPTDLAGVLATITDVSKVESYKKSMGSKYAVAPLPYVDETHTTRMGSYLGYKFFGVNSTLSKEDKTKASNVAKFLCSEYAQAKRLEQYYVRPTLKSLDVLAMGEPHVAALIKQSDAKATIPLLATASELWSGTASAADAIRKLENPTQKDFEACLAELDALLTKQ